MGKARDAAFAANAAARDLTGAAREAAYAAGQAAAVGASGGLSWSAAAYAIRAARAASPERDDAGRVGATGSNYDEIRDLVLDDQRLRNELCWFVFEC